MFPPQNTFLKRALRLSHQAMQSVLLPFNLGELVRVQSIEYSAGAGAWPSGWVSNPVLLLWSESLETLTLWTPPLGCSPTLCRGSPHPHGGAMARSPRQQSQLSPAFALPQARYQTCEWRTLQMTPALRYLKIPQQRPQKFSGSPKSSLLGSIWIPDQ